MSDAFTRLQELLRELFQFDNKDLDFGIYRIMNHKRGAVEDFIRNGLADAVDEALKGGEISRQVAHAETLRQATQAAKTALGEGAIDSSGELDPKYRDTPAGSEYLEALSGRASRWTRRSLGARSSTTSTRSSPATTTTATSSPSAATPAGRSTRSRTTARRSTCTGRTPTSTT